MFRPLPNNCVRTGANTCNTVYVLLWVYSQLVDRGHKEIPWCNILQLLSQLTKMAKEMMGEEWSEILPLLKGIGFALLAIQMPKHIILVVQL